MTTKRAMGVLLVVAAISAGCSGAEVGSTEDAAESSAALVGVDTWLYFRSNATAWGVDDSTRLLPFVAGTFARAYNVTQPWMVSSGDSAIVTETNALNGWGTTQKSYGTASTVNEPAFVLLTTQNTFTVKYAATGLKRVVVDPTVSPPTLTIQPVTCPNCPAPTHCVVAPNSMPSCVP